MSNPQPSTTMTLAQLEQQYNTLLTQYRTAVTDYNTYLKDQASLPCAGYTENSKNINQQCIDHLWNRSGCGTGNVRLMADNSDIKTKTLNELIDSSHMWATTAQDTYRKGCYGTSTNYSKATQPDYKVNGPPLVTIQGYAFNGTSSIGIDASANTLDLCKASCAKMKNCSGATFVSPRCTLNTGDSPIMPASQTSYAIVSKEKQLLLNMETLNTQLLSVNQQILTLLKQSQPTYTKTTKDSNAENIKLLKNYDDLMKERKEITDLLADYDSLEVESNRNTYKQYYGYWVWTILLVFILWGGYSLLIGTYVPSPTPTVQYGGSLGVSAYYVVGLLVILVVILNRTWLA